MSPDFQSLLSTTWSFFLVVVFFGGSIFVHELGHFLAARRRGAHVERFSIGFGPAIWSWRGKDGVEYRISWIPLGGYVMLPQLADLGPVEGERTADVKKLPPIDYVSKLLILAAGATFNILFAFALAGVVWIAGQPTLSLLATTKIGMVAPTIKLDGGKPVPNPAAEAGLQPGDIVRAIDGRSVANFEDILNGVALGNDRTAEGRRRSVFTIERDGRTLTLTVYPLLWGEEKMRDAGVLPAEDLTADAILPDSPAAAAGVKAGDRILALDGIPVFNRGLVSEHLAKNPNRATEFLFDRGGRKITLAVQPRLETEPGATKPVARIGLRYRENVVILHPTPWQQIADDIGTTFRTLGALLSPTSDIGPSKLSGPIGIARQLHQEAQWDFRRALWFVILVNVNLAIFNLLPIPVLDGGQIAFATVARLRRRELPANFIVAAQSAFMLLLLSLVLYVSFFDVQRWRRDLKADRVELAAPAQPAK